MSFENKIGCTVHVLSMNQLYLRDQINIFEQAIAISNDSNIFNQIETTQVVVIFDFNRRLVYLRLLDAELEILNYYQTRQCLRISLLLWKLQERLMRRLRLMCRMSLS